MEAESKHLQKNKVHHILAHSYLIYFVSFLIGVCLDLVFKFKIFTNSVMVPVGLMVLLLSSLLILWAQKSSRNFNKDTISKEAFRRGPYNYVRNPTNLGLFFLALGFGILANAFFVILSTLISLLISKFIFLEKEERVLAAKYGAPYLEYKKSVKF